MEKNIFNYTASTRRNHSKLTEGDIIIVTRSSMSQYYDRAVFLMSGYAKTAGYIDTMYNPLYLFRVKTLKPPVYDHIPGF